MSEGDKVEALLKEAIRDPEFWKVSFFCLVLLFCAYAFAGDAIEWVRRKAHEHAQRRIDRWEKKDRGT